MTVFATTVFGPSLVLGADGDAASKAVGAKSLLEYITAGGAVGYVLILLSVVALSLAILNLIQIRRARMAPEDVVMEIGRLLRERNMPAVIQLCAAPEADCFLTRVLRGAITRCSRSPFGFLEVRTALEESGQRELDSMMRPTDGLGLIASLGPMMGLLGTVIGIIGAFAAIGEAEGAARSQMLATYMSMALVTTAEGLIVAIPCTFAYALFRKRTERLGVQVGDIIEEWIPMFEPDQAQAVPPTAPMPNAPRPRPAARPVIGDDAARGVRTA